MAILCSCARALGFHRRRARLRWRAWCAPRFDAAEFEGTFTVAASDYAVAVVLPKVLKQLRLAAPRLKLAVRPVQSATLEADLRDNRVDFALTIPEFTPEGLRQRKLFSERYVGVLRRGHPLDGRKIDLDAFCAFPHLLVSPDKGDFRGAVDEALASVGRRRDVALVLPTFAVVGAVLDGGDLIAVLPSRLANANPALRQFRPPVPVKGFDLCGVCQSACMPTRRTAGSGAFASPAGRRRVLTGTMRLFSTSPLKWGGT